MPSARADRWGFAGLALVLFAYVVLRAATVPLVHDEATSFIAYAQSGRMLPFASMWDANNHFLNSLYGHIGYRLFGLHPLALRWASVLSYALYAWCAWRIGGRIEHRSVRWLLWAALLACPFLLDFFSLFRGYGPALALFLLAVHHVLRYVEAPAARTLILGLSALTLACGFVLALLPVAFILLVLLFAQARRDAAQLAIWALLGLAPWALLALLARHMATLGLLYHGNAAGYGETTIGSLLRYALGIEGLAWRAAVSVLFIAVGIALLWRRQGGPVLLIAAALWGEYLLRLVLAQAAGLNYAEDRAALHVLLLGILFLAFAADALGKRWPWSAALALPLVAFPVRSAFTANVDRTVMWPEQSIPPRFIARIEAMEQRLNRPAVVGMHRLALLPYALQRRMRGGEGDGTALAAPCDGVDAWIAFWPVEEQLGCGFVVVDSAAMPGLQLLVREPQRPGRVVSEERFDLRLARRERSEGFVIDPGVIRREGAIVELAGALALEPDGADLRLALAAWDSSGTALHADHVLLATRRGAWHGEPFRMARWIPPLPTASRVEVFLWSMDKAVARLTDGRARQHAVE